MNTKSQRLALNNLLGMACWIALSAASAQASDKQWSSGTADYNNAANWLPSGIPGATDNAINDHGFGNAVQISLGNPDWIVGQIRAGNSTNNGEFIQNAQTVTALGTNYNGPVISEFFTPFRLGIVANRAGAYTLNGGTLNYGSGPFNVGEVGAGTLNLNGGNIVGNGVFSVNSGGIAVPNPAVLTGTAGHGPYLGDYTYYEVGYAPAPHAGTGLPAAGTTITSVTQGDHSFKFAPTYTANNAFILDTAISNATVTLSTPTVCSSLSFMGSAGNGPVVVNYTVNHTAGAPETGSLSVPDWFGSGQEVFNVEGRVDARGVNLQYPGTAGGNPVGNAPYLLSVDIDTSANPNAISSIQLSYVSGGGSFATATILGVSGQTTVSDPFLPLTVTGYNSDVVVEAAAPSPFVSNLITDVVNQTGGTNTVNNQLYVAQGSTANGIYNLSNGELDIQSWTVIGRNGGKGVFNMTGGTLNKFNNGGNFIVGSASGDNSLAGTVGTLNQSSGTINCNSEYWIAENALTVATNNISGNAVLNLHNWMSIGRGGLGVLNISGNARITQDGNNWQFGDGGDAIINQSGGTNDVSGELRVALNSGRFATYNMSGGVLNARNWFQVGRGGAALLNFTGGTINKTNNGAFIIGDNATDSARVIQTGAGAVFNCANDYFIGNNTFGELDFTNAVLTTQTLSDGNNGTGLFYQSGGNVTVNGELWLGQGGAGNGTYELTGGGTIVVHNWVSIGRNGGFGTMNLVNGSISKVDSGNFSIGGDGGANGTLNQAAGTTLSVVPSDATFIGQGTGNGTWNMDGGSANLGLLQFCEGGNGSGVLNLNTGLIRATEVNSGTNGVPSNSTLNFNGGTLQAGSDNANFFHDVTTVNLNADAIIDSQGYNVTALQNLPSNGGNGSSGLIKLGSGTLTLAGTNTYTGATSVNNGVLGATTTAITGTSGFSVASGAGLGVQVVGTLNSQFTAPSVVMAAPATSLNFDLGNFGNPTVAPLFVNGGLTANGTITVNIADSAAALGQMPLVKYVGTITGSPTFVIGSLPTGVSAYVSNNVANQSIDLVISGLNQPRWDGQAGGTWDTLSDTNWVNIGTGLPVAYTDPSVVLFDDSALGTTTVTLPGTVNPLGVTVNNTNLAYTFTGPGKISGSKGLTKLGSNTLTIANTNDYTGPTVIANGTLSVANLSNFGVASPIGKAAANPTNLVFAGGTLSYSGPAVTINRPYTTSTGATPSGIDSLNNVTFSSLVSGNGGEFQKKGPSQLAYVAAGSNNLTGYTIANSAFRVRGGSVLLDGSAGQTNYIRSLYTGADAGVDTSMTLSNTILWVRNNLVVGQTNATATMTLTNSTLNYEGQSDALKVGDAGGSPVTAVFNQNNSTVNMNGNQWFVGNSANANATWNLSSGSINVHDWVVIGRQGANGTLNMTGGTINHNNNAFITGSANNSVGTINMSGGTINAANEYWLAENGGDIATNNISGTAVVNIHSWASVGRGGLGVINLTNGGKIHKFNDGGRFNVADGNNNGGHGIINMSSNTTFTCDADLDLGHGGNTGGGGPGSQAEFNLSGGTVTVGNVNAHTWFTMGRDGAGSSTLNMSGGSMEFFGEAHIGEGGWTSTINMSGGVINAHDWFQIGRGGVARLNMTGGTINKDNNGAFVISDNSAGVFVQNGGVFNAAGEFNMGFNNNTAEYDLTNGVLNANGPIRMITDNNTTINQAGGTINSTSDLRIGEGGTSGIATYNLTGGTLNSSGQLFLGYNGGRGILNLDGGVATVNGFYTNGVSTGTANFNGGLLVAGVDNVKFMTGITAANVLAGGARIDTGSKSITIAQPLLDGGGAGGLTKTGNGTLLLSGVNTYTGTTTVSAGTLGGIGTIAGPVLVSSGATFSPGASIGTMTINNALTLAVGSTTVMEVNKTANTSDLVTGTGNSVSYGGTLVLKNLSGALQVNDTFTLFTAGTRTGSFSSVVSQTPNQNVTWDLSQLNVNGTVRVASAIASPVVLSPVVIGGQLNFTWPANQIGWQLQHQINPLTIGLYTNWLPVAGSTTTNAVSVPLDSSKPTEFYRLAFPAQ